MEINWKQVRMQTLLRDALVFGREAARLRNAANRACNYPGGRERALAEVREYQTRSRQAWSALAELCTRPQPGQPWPASPTSPRGNKEEGQCFTTRFLGVMAGPR